ncbi:MAG: peptidyl-prolyl cis-trans isomerase [Deltaproteobacteria bacterium]|jgi:peptidyl-prolyl cis-trans isomerase B (cyclophilin B)|nr:peptidyl-prolyl cis-trans isomerase [Deltaproteobacteria bacterium]
MKRLLIVVLFVTAVAFSAAAGDNPKVILETSKGNIVLELYADKAPETVSNFLAYVDAQYYNNTIFHRVIPNFMIQGGGFTADMQKKKTRAPIRNEADNGLPNQRGTVAMARTPDPHSAGAQFFINSKNNDFLNHKNKTPQGWGYAVFGHVVEGMGVVDTISEVKTVTSGRFRDVPAEPVIITRAARLP